MNKSDLRKKFLSLRKHDKNLDTKVINNLLSIIKDYKTVALYYAINEEISLNDLFLHLSNKITLYLPYTSKELEFKKFTSFEALSFDKARIPSPTSKSVEVSNIEVVVMACIACSTNGYRLGYGAGYYDRALKDYKGLKIGVTYDNCLVDFDFSNSYDVRLDYIITESQIIKIGE